MILEKHNIELINITAEMTLEEARTILTCLKHTTRHTPTGGGDCYDKTPLYRKTEPLIDLFTRILEDHYPELR
jgi:hypothetical protein